MRIGRALCMAAIAAATISMAGCGNRGSGPAPQAASTVHFVNSPANAKAPGLSDHFIDFSFDYPKGWTVDPETGTANASNFVKVERSGPGGITAENFGVGQFTGSPALIPEMFGQIESQLSGIAGYKRLGEGPTTFKGQPAQEMTFTITPTFDGKVVNAFGRMVAVPGPNGATGVVISYMATDITGEIKSIDDLGVKGELPVILSSFHVGK